MSDFHQEGIITTLHNLYEAFDPADYLSRLELKLEAYSQHLRICLLLPSLYSEIEPPSALNKILDEIAKVRYLHRVVVALGGAEEEGRYKRAKSFFSRLKTERRDVKVVWVDGPRIQRILKKIQGRDISTGVPGKGQSVWAALGYIFAAEDVEVIALHDCDILTYDRILLGRLIEPTANPNNEFEFCKGFYPRISPVEKAMKGRATRLFVTPFVDAMVHIMYQRNYRSLERFFQYHRTFKYPLAGEFSFLSRLARGINIACDWGLEVSTLSEVYERLIPKKITQIGLINNYEHKHQELSPEDATRGLHRMVVDIATFFFNHLRSNGVPLNDSFVDMIQHTYYTYALAFIKSYSDDAEVNNLAYDRYQEELTVRYFRDFLWTAWEKSRADAGGSLIPSWNRVLYSLPEIYEDLRAAVEEDNL